MGINVYFLLFGGVYSKRKYSYLGGIRRCVARVRYEIIFSLNLLLFILYSKRYTVVFLANFGLILVFITTFIRTLVELGRTPFDYSESERELVRGFNTEYSGVGFVLLFLKEYGRLLFFRIFLSSVYFNGRFVVVVFIFRSYVVLRRTLPRYRYDQLIGLIWLELFFFVRLVCFSTYYLFRM